MPLETEEHWRNVAARLRDLPGAVMAYRQTMESDIAAGLPPRRRQVLAVAKQAKRNAAGFFTELVAPAPDGLRSELDTGASAAAQAFQDFARFLIDEVARSRRATRSAATATPSQAVTSSARRSISTRPMPGAWRS